MYHTLWNSRHHEVLPTVHERNNPYDHYAVAAGPGRISESTVGHLPIEISRITRYIILYGAMVTVEILDTHCRRSPLVQGGLELPVKVVVKMDYSLKNRQAIAKYESLVNQLYKEPVGGVFEDVTAAVLGDMDHDTDEEEEESEGSTINN